MKHRHRVSWLILGLALLTLAVVFVISATSTSPTKEGPAGAEEPPRTEEPSVAEEPSCSTEPSRSKEPTRSGEPTLVKDIAPGRASGYPVEFHRFEDRLFFSAEDGNSQRELWVSDGTEAGTSLFKDLNASSGSSPMHFATHDGSLYFTAQGSAQEGWELWKSDGTADGTVLLKDINPSGSSGGAQPTEFTAAARTLFFTSYGDYAYFKLWKTDGTEAGTVQVNDVGASWLTVLDDELIFAGYKPGAVPGLWKSDGTRAGTVRVMNFGNRSGPAFLTAVGDSVFFTADTEAEGSELWKTDGTEAGTVLVSDVASGPESSNPYQLECVGDALFFWGTDTSGDTELWKSDGTAARTVRVKDINPNGRAIPLDFEPQELVEVGGRLFFHADGGPDSGVEVWTSDGTEEGTHIVKDIRPGSGSSSPSLLTDIEGTLYFAANDGKTGLELWRSNASGTDAERVTDLNPKGDSVIPDPGALLVPLDGALYFGGDDGVHGYEIWKLPL